MSLSFYRTCRHALNPARFSLRTLSTVTASASSAPTPPPPSNTTTTDALKLIRSQPNNYIVASLAGRKYLLAPCDVLTVPRLNDVRVGDSIALDTIHELGSRDYTLRATAGDKDAAGIEGVEVRATVLEHTKGPMEVIFKKKRRKGYERTVKHKQTYTRLRIGEIGIKADVAMA